jgi:hypothetical protein
MNTEPDYDTIDKLSEYLTYEPQTPSALARQAKVRTTSTYAALDWMVNHAYAVRIGNGARSKYRSRYFGERTPFSGPWR